MGRLAIKCQSRCRDKNSGEIRRIPLVASGGWCPGCQGVVKITRRNANGRIKKVRWLPKGDERQARAISIGELIYE